MREAFGARWAVVPYVMPGFALAKLAAEVFERDAAVEGLVLLESRPVHVRRRRAHRLRAHDRRRRPRRALRRAARPRASGRRCQASVPIDLRAPTRPRRASRRCCGALLAEPSGDADRPWRRMVLEYRAERRLARRSLARPDAGGAGAREPAHPDHVIRTKGPRAGPRRVPAARRRCGAARARLRGRRGTSRAATTPTSRPTRRARGPGHEARRHAARRPRARRRHLRRRAHQGTTRASPPTSPSTRCAPRRSPTTIGRYRALADPRPLRHGVLECSSRRSSGRRRTPPLAGQVALVTGAAGRDRLRHRQAAGRGRRARACSPTSTRERTRRGVSRSSIRKRRGARRGPRDGRHRRGVGGGRLRGDVPALRRPRHPRAERRRRARERARGRSTPRRSAA